MYFLLKNWFLVSILVILVCASVTIVDAETLPKQIPVIESLDLLVDGSVSPVTITLTQDFDVIMRFIFELEYDDPSFIGEEFAEAGPLTNGTCICVNGDSLFDFNITQNDDFMRMSYDTTVFHDDKEPKVTHVFTRLSFCNRFFGGCLIFCNCRFCRYGCSR